MRQKLMLLALIFLILAPISVGARYVDRNELRPGDLILLPLDCYLCQMIEDETQSIFSHIGIIIRNREGKLMVAESWGKVRMVTISSFLIRSEKGQSCELYRSYQLDDLYSYKEFFNQFSAGISKLYFQKFQGLRFDSNFLWDNVDDQGKEKLYCSEFVTKILNSFLNDPITPYPMTFERNWQFWNRYFKGNVPQGELGNSPAFFEKSNRFFMVGKIK